MTMFCSVVIGVTARPLTGVGGGEISLASAVFSCSPSHTNIQTENQQQSQSDRPAQEHGPNTNMDSPLDTGNVKSRQRYH